MEPRSPDRMHRLAKLAVDLAMTLQIGEPQLSDIEQAALLYEPHPAAGAPRPATETQPLPDRILRVADAYDLLVTRLGCGPSDAVRALDLLARERILDLDPLVLGALKVLQPPPSPR